MKRVIEVDINRVEGDLELRLELDGNRVTDAWSSGTMFRGFERLLKGRHYTDSLVVTPRVCGICGTAHLYSAVTAIEKALSIPVAPNGTRVRNICLLAEEIQSDSRHTFLMYTIDFVRDRYKTSKFYPALVAAFTPFSGEIYRETIRKTKEMLEIVSLFGGQWPHSSYMVPGGVTIAADAKMIRQSLTIVENYIHWYEEKILGCTLDRYAEIDSIEQLRQWLDEDKRHRNAAMGLFIRAGRSAELQLLGRGCGNLLSYGNYFDPELWSPPYNDRPTLRKSGYHQAGSSGTEPFRQELITEHIRYSWYKGYDGGVHPLSGMTEPDYRSDDDRYSWAKAPRYQGEVAEVGPLSELVIDGDALIGDFFRREGSNAFVRQFCRLHRPTKSLPLLRSMLQQLLTEFDAPWFLPPTDHPRSGQGYGMIAAARGALGHWVEIEDEKISHYQMITPTGWNASPRDSHGKRGHMEESLIGTELRDESDPVELGHIVRSHDACLVCTVHALDDKFRY